LPTSAVIFLYIAYTIINASNEYFNPVSTYGINTISLSPFLKNTVLILLFYAISDDGTGL
jgi:hypothetical protein